MCELVHVLRSTLKFCSAPFSSSCMLQLQNYDAFSLDADECIAFLRESDITSAGGDNVSTTERLVDHFLGYLSPAV